MLGRRRRSLDNISAFSPCIRTHIGCRLFLCCCLCYHDIGRNKLLESCQIESHLLCNFFCDSLARRPGARSKTFWLRFDIFLSEGIIALHSAPYLFLWSFLCCLQKTDMPLCHIVAYLSLLSFPLFHLMQKHLPRRISRYLSERLSQRFCNSHPHIA